MCLSALQRLVIGINSVNGDGDDDNHGNGDKDNNDDNESDNRKKYIIIR